MSEEPVAPLSRRGTLLLVAGLVILILAVFMLNLTIRTMTLWWHQAD